MNDNPWENEYQRSQPAPIYESLWQRLKTFLKTTHAKSVLDFGCGDGSYSNLMQNMGILVTGIDVSSNAIKIAKSSWNSKQIKFINDDSIPTNLPDNSFDVLVMLNVLHCLAFNERSNLLKQAKRVLKRNGYLFTSVLATEDESYPREKWEEIGLNTFNDGAGKLFHFFTLAEIVHELKGLTVIRSNLLENIHPDIGRKSSLHIVIAEKSF